MHYKVSIIIPNRNGAKLLESNLQTVLAAADGNEIIVVDDASTDESLAILRQRYPTVKIVSMTSHSGFAGSVNKGVREASGDIVVLLNTDVRPKKGFLTPLLRHFDNPSVFGVGCLEKSIEGEGVVLRGRGEAQWEKGFFIHHRGEVEATTTAWASGGSSAFRKSIWDKLGGLDPMFNPFYWEDIDLSYRALKSGYIVIFEPQSIVVHEHTAGAIMQEYSPPQVRMVAYRNQFLFIWKNVSNGKILVDHAIWTPIRLVQALFRGDWAMLIGYIMALSRLPQVLISRVHSSHYWKLDDIHVPLG